MRQISNTVRTLLEGDYVEAFHLVKIETRPTAETTSVVMRSSSVAVDINIPGDGLYTVSDLLSIDPPKTSTTLDRSVYNITFIDPLFTKRALFEGNLNGTKATVYLGFFNTFETVYNGTQPGQPFLGIGDIITIYAGFVDTCSYTLNPAEGTVVANIECNSPMNSLNLKRSLYTSREELRAINATDSAFDHVYAGSSKFTLKWGKT